VYEDATPWIYEVQTVALVEFGDNPLSGHWYLTYDPGGANLDTSLIASDASSGVVAAALQGLAGVGEVEVSREPPHSLRCGG
jgi:hypothetical protein